MAATRWPAARCPGCGYVEREESGGPYADVFLYVRECPTCHKLGCDVCVPQTRQYPYPTVDSHGLLYPFGECLDCRKSRDGADAASEVPLG